MSRSPGEGERPLRGLLLLVSVIVLVDTSFFAALTPLLPYYVEEFSLSDSAAGLLSAIYAAGATIGAVPGGLLAVRWGAKTTVVAGLLVMVGTSIIFGIADTSWGLYVGRFGQGIGSAISWTGAFAWLVSATPQDRRGKVIGIAMGAAVTGALLGPVLGGAAALVGPAPAFIAVASLGVLLAIWAWKTPVSSRSNLQRPNISLGILGEGKIIVGYWYVCLAAILLGVISVVGPLKLDDLGWGAVAISLVFALSAGVEAALNPILGSWSDRSGRLQPLRLGLILSVGASLGLASIRGSWATLVLVAVACIVYGFFWVPGTALFSDGGEAVGLEQGLVFASLNLAWAPANFLGAIMGGFLADAGGGAYLLVVGLCLVSLLIERFLPRTAGRVSG